MFKRPISKKKLLEFIRGNKIFRLLTNSSDLAIPLHPLRKVRESLALKLRPLDSLAGRVKVFLQTHYLDAKKNKINLLSRILILISVFLLFLLVLEFAGGRPHPNLLAPREGLVGQSRNASSPQSKPLVYYSNEIGRKELFQSGPGSGTPLGAEKSEASNITLAKLAENLVLLGVAVDHQPRAFIEDQKRKKTYFLGVGEFIGPIKIEAIVKGKVILGYRDESLELVL